MQSLKLLTARDKVLADTKRYVAELRSLLETPIETVEDGIRVLAALRRATYEDLNQIQHEFAALRAIEWLRVERLAPEAAVWEWNPRQTGDAAEPDVRAVWDDVTVISGEVTTSPKPKGLIDSRMATTLKKLSVMDGRRFYFVLTQPMANRARTKVFKAGYAIDVVQL